MEKDAGAGSFLHWERGTAKVWADRADGQTQCTSQAPSGDRACAAHLLPFSSSAASSLSRALGLRPWGGGEVILRAVSPAHAASVKSSQDTAMWMGLRVLCEGPCCRQSGRVHVQMVLLRGGGGGGGKVVHANTKAITYELINTSRSYQVSCRSWVWCAGQPCCLAARVFFLREGGRGGTLQARKWACMHTVRDSTKTHSVGWARMHTVRDSTKTHSVGWACMHTVRDSTKTHSVGWDCMHTHHTHTGRSHPPPCPPMNPCMSL